MDEMQYTKIKSRIERENLGYKDKIQDRRIKIQATRTKCRIQG